MKQLRFVSLSFYRLKLRYQQNLAGRRLAILVLPTTSWPEISQHDAEVLTAVNTIAAGDLVLEPQVAGHAAAMFLVLSDPAIFEFENAPPKSQAWLEERFARLESRHSANGHEQWLNWVIRLPSGELAGYVQATVTREFVAYVAYELASKFWRRGIGSIAVGAMLTELGAIYRVKTFVAILTARNARSMAFLRHLGFSVEPPAGLTPVEHESDELVMYKGHVSGQNAG